MLDVTQVDNVTSIGHLPNGSHPSPRAAQHPETLQVRRRRTGRSAGEEQVGHGVGTLEGRRLGGHEMDDFKEKSGKNHGKPMGKPWKNHGKLEIKLGDFLIPANFGN